MNTRAKRIRDQLQPDELQNETSLKIRRIMIVGASGYLGSALTLGLRDEYEVIGSYFQSPTRIEGAHFYAMNCFNGNEIIESVQRYNPDFIFYCAGISDLKKCTDNPMLSSALNTKAMMLFFKVLSKSIPLMYFSCDHVFNELKPENPSFRLNEESDTDPPNEWGLSRYKGETKVLENRGLTYVFRLPRIYGERLGSPFYPRETWIHGALKNFASKDRFGAISDQWRSSLYIGDAVRAVRLFLSKAPVKSKIYNICPSDSVTPFESAQLLASVFGQDPDLVDPIKLANYLQGKSYVEPTFCSMSGKLFEDNFSFKCQSLEEGLGEIKARLSTGYTQNWI